MTLLRHDVSPVDDEALQQRFLVRTLSGLAWCMGAVALATEALDWLTDYPTEHLRVAWALVAALAAWRCARIGRVHLGLSVVLLTVAGIICLSVYDGGGIDALQISAAALAIVLAGCMFGPNWAVGSTMLVALALLGVAHWQVSGLLPTTDLSTSPYRRAFVHLQSLALLGGLCWFFFSRIQEQLAQLRQAQEKLKADERRFSDYMRAAGDWFWESDTEGRFTWMSDSVQIVTGDAPTTYYGKIRGDLLRPEQLTSEVWSAHMQTIARREPFRDFRYVHNTQHGKRWLSISGVPHWKVDGQFMGYRGSASDISRHVHDTEAALGTNALLRSAIEEIDEIFSLSDPQDRIVLTNHSFRKINPGVESLLAQNCRYEDYLRWACASGYMSQSTGRVEAFIAERLEMRRRPTGKPFELMHYDGRHLLVRDHRLVDGSTVTVGVDVTAQKAQERLLAASEKHLRDVLDNARGVAVQFYDEDGHIVYWNHAAEEVFGYTAEEMLGSQLDERMLSAEHVVTWQQGLKALRPHEPPRDPVEMAITHKNGTQRVLLSNTFAIEEPDGSLRVACMDIDVTSRKHMEEELRTSRRLLEQVIDAIPMAIFAKDTTSHYVMVNRHFTDLFGTDKASILHQHTSRTTLPEVTRIQSIADDQWVYQHRETLDQDLMPLQASDGRWISFHSSKIPLFDDDGELIGLLGINRDITEELRAQATLRASEARFSALFHNARVPQLVSDPQAGVIEDVNHSFSELLGRKANELIGGTATGEWAVFCNPKTANPAGVQEIVLSRSDGSERIVFGSVFTIDTPMGERLAWSLQDVTDQRAAQEQMRQMNLTLEHAVQQRTEQLTLANADLRNAMHTLKASQEALLQSEKLAALGRVVAGVAHELNTPIGNSLLSATTLAHQTDALANQVAQGLRRSTLENYVSTVREVVTILLRNLERSSQLIGSFKQLAADQTSSQRRTFDLKTMVDEVLLSQRPMLRTARIDVRTEMSDGLTMDSYPGPLGQVLANLLSNAAVHGYEGREDGGSVTIVAAPTADGQVKLQIADEGRGIDAESLRRIFDPFYTTRLGRGGSGLGLHIVHNIVTGLLGGTVCVESTPGHGTRFTVALPRVAPSKAVGGRPDNPTTPPPIK